MAKKIVDDILAAEAEGEEIIARAEEEARRHIADAKAEAKTIADNARAENAARLKTAVDRSQTANEDAAEKARNETAKLREEYEMQAAARRSQAVARVIEILRQP